jgi:hypothetical protein
MENLAGWAAEKIFTIRNSFQEFRMVITEFHSPL